MEVAELKISCKLLPAAAMAVDQAFLTSMMRTEEGREANVIGGPKRNEVLPKKDGVI